MVIMMGLKKIIRLVLFLLWSFNSYAQKAQTTTDKEPNIPNYGDRDLDRFKSYYLKKKDSIILVKKKNSADSASTILLQLLESTYDERPEGISKRDLDLIIHSFYSSEIVLKRFDEISKDLETSDAKKTKIRTDSLLNSLEKLKESLKKDN